VEGSGMDEAWRAVMAVLPRGYALMLRGSDDWLGRSTWKADAYHSDGRRKTWHAEAVSAPAVLQALAVKIGATR